MPDEKARSRQYEDVKQGAAGDFQWFEESAFSSSPRGEWILECLRKIRRAVAAVGNPIPPVDLNRLARSLGVEDVRSVSLHIQGRVTRVAEKLLIELSDQLSPRPQRFTLAHELSHIVLGDRPPHISYDEFERLCDLGASEILLPYTWLRQVLDPRRPSLESLRDAAQLADCALDVVLEHALAVRLAAFTEVFWWWWSNGRVTVRKAFRGYVARDSNELSDLIVSEQPPFTLVDVVASDGIVRGVVLLTEHGQTRTVVVDCTRLQNGHILAVRAA